MTEEIDRATALAMMAAWNNRPVEQLIKMDEEGVISHITIAGWHRVYMAAKALITNDINNTVSVPETNLTDLPQPTPGAPTRESTSVAVAMEQQRKRNDIALLSLCLMARQSALATSFWI